MLPINMTNPFTVKWLRHDEKIHKVPQRPNNQTTRTIVFVITINVLVAVLRDLRECSQSAG